MVVLTAQLTGLVLFVAGTTVLGILLRRSPSLERAERLSRISHLLFWLGLVLPWTIGVFFPGGAAFDDIAGMGPLPLSFPARLVVGLPMVIGGVALMQLSISGLKREGRGAPALVLTQSVVTTGVYGVVRNPMALGFYIGLLGGAVLSGSGYVIVYTLGIIAAHIFNLRYFEEFELAQRYDASYDRYRSSVPFLFPRLKFWSRES